MCRTGISGGGGGGGGRVTKSVVRTRRTGTWFNVLKKFRSWFIASLREIVYYMAYLPYTSLNTHVNVIKNENTNG